MKDRIVRIGILLSVLGVLASCKKDSTEPAIYKPSYGVPSISIVTEKNEPVVTKETHVPCTVKVFDDGEDKPYVNAPAKIHVRGNATAGYPKKPYKIRFDEKQSLCGFPENKDWVLLALYCDHSLVREQFLNLLAEKVGLPYCVHRQYVTVTLNGTKLGVYLLTDQVEKAKGRVELDDNGFIIERDNNWSKEPLWVTTARGHNFTFKYPDADDGKIVQDDEEFLFIKQFLDLMESAVYGKNFDAKTGYRKYIDADSWAGWFLAQELAGNLDTNPYYYLKNHDSKLVASPVWDAEWSFGLAAVGTSGWATPPAKPVIEGTYWGNSTYYRYFFLDPYFVKLVKQKWDKLKPQIPQICEEIQAMAKDLNRAQTLNFKVWPILNEYTSVGLVHFGNFQAEVDYVIDFFREHAEWFDGWINEKYNAIAM